MSNCQVEKIEYQLNGGPITTYKYPIGISQGQVTLKYRAVDYVGNSEKWKSLHLIGRRFAVRIRKI